MGVHAELILIIGEQFLDKAHIAGVVLHQEDPDGLRGARGSGGGHHVKYRIECPAACKKWSHNTITSPADCASGLPW
jgi:hypothetical protein